VRNKIHAGKFKFNPHIRPLHVQFRVPRISVQFPRVQKLVILRNRQPYPVDGKLWSPIFRTLRCR